MIFKILAYTVVVSLVVQAVTGIVGLHGLFISLEKEDMILWEILLMEMIVQTIEFIFYIWLSFGLFRYTIQKSNFSLYDVTKRRYIDWFITTPTMLLSTIMFLKYLEIKDKKEKREKGIEIKEDYEETQTLQFMNFIKTHKNFIINMILLNAGMLLFGYLGEINHMDKKWSVSIGSIFLILNFYLIYKEFGEKTKIGTILFLFMFVVWSLYGVAAVLPFYYKNISYNILDVFAKNFFGIFIYIIILVVKKKEVDIS
jgi:bacteriorhodopsin